MLSTLGEKYSSITYFMITVEPPLSALQLSEKSEPCLSENRIILKT